MLQVPGLIHYLTLPTSLLPARVQKLVLLHMSSWLLQTLSIPNFLWAIITVPETEENNKALAYVHAQQAQERASCDGPLHSYKKAFDEAQHLLKLIHGS